MKITFVGGGNMASALISGLLRQGFSVEQLQVIEINHDGREKLKQNYGISVFENLAEGIADCDIIVLSVKPQQLRDLTRDLVPVLDNQLVISIAAGIRASDIVRWLNGHNRVIRAMPNTPSLVGSGVAGLYATPGIDQQDKKNAESDWT